MFFPTCKTDIERRPGMRGVAVTSTAMTDIYRFPFSDAFQTSLHHILKKRKNHDFFSGIGRGSRARSLQAETLDLSRVSFPRTRSRE